MRRFGGTVEDLGAVDHVPMRDRILGVPFEAWPQQARGPDGGLRPAMVNDPGWHGLKDLALPIVKSLVARLMPVVLGGLVLEPDRSHQLAWCATNHMLSVVMPGHRIEPHVDRQDPSWIARVHVPLQTDVWAAFSVEGAIYEMRPGRAYLVNVEREHDVWNGGDLPRVHFMFDVKTF